MSKTLFSADWHLAVSTLDIVEKVTDEVISICKKHHVDYFVHLGDLKSDYSPIDGRVINAGVRTVDRIIKAGVKYLQLKGNHDRYNLFTSFSSWLPVLRKAGAITYDMHTGEKLGDGTEICFLPFENNDDEFKKHARELARITEAKRKAGSLKFAILAFHQDIKGAHYNVLRKESESDLNPKDLCPEAYDFCIGGDLHLPQKVVYSKGNIHYTGSPYPVDGGEANQRKGYILIDTLEGTFKRVYTELPRLFDLQQPGFKESAPEDFKGHTVRDRIVVRKDDDIQEKVAKRQRQLEKRYPGAIIEVRHNYAELEGQDDVHDLSVPDRWKVKRYLTRAIPSELADDYKRIFEYIWHRLQESHVGLRQKERIKFLWAEGRNVLSFKRVRIDFTRPGVTLVTGVNRDWGRRSNGSGKTSFLSILAIAGWGQTFKKGQVNDRWAKRGTKDTAIASFAFENSKRDIYKVVRTRRPAKLKLFKRKDDVWKNFSAGNRKEINQRQIEELTGYTFETLASAVYIDQKNINTLLTGTDSDRKKILTRVQNTENYQKAQERVKLDLRSTEAFYEKLGHRAEIVINRLKSVAEHFAVVRDVPKLENALRAKYKRKKDALRAAKERKSGLGVDERLKLAREQLNEDSKKLYIANGNILGQLGSASKSLKAMASLGSECPTCKQSVPKSHVEEVKRKLFKLKAELRQDAVKFRKELDECNMKMKIVSEEILKAEDDLGAANEDIYRLTTETAQIKEQLYQLKVQVDYAKRLKRKRTKLREELRWIKRARRGLRRDKAIFEFCVKVLSKDGLPAFLNSYLCPLLNAAAERYSDLFGDGYLKVRFDVEEGDFVVTVDNPNGGEQGTDQSLGEERTASYITSFAAKDVMTPCNVMMIDEPGEGLDEIGARQFAQRLKEIASHIGCVFVTSHKQEIVSELSGGNHIVVRKRNGTSRVFYESKTAQLG